MKFIFLILIFLYSSTLLVYSQKAERTDTILEDNSFFFEYDIKYVGKSTSIAANDQYVMQFLLEQLTSNPSWDIHIRGHVCCGPNKRISKRRARKAFRFLKKMGVEKERITHKGYSNNQPVAFPEKTDDDARRNRRVDFIITKN